MSVQVKTPTKTQFEHTEFQCGELSSSKTTDDIKNDQSKFSQPRKRRYSQSYRRGDEWQSIRRKRLKSSPPEKMVLPTKFLLGGNISDPLNLNGLCTGEVGKILNEKTPQSSPVPVPEHRGPKTVAVVFPTNITDPLNLNSGDDADLSRSLSGRKKKRHNKHKKKEESSSFIHPQNLKEAEKKSTLTEALKIDVEPEPIPVLPVNIEVSKSAKILSDKIVSPVLQQTSPKSKKRRATFSGGKPEASSSVAKSILVSPGSPSHTTDSKKCSPHKKFRRSFSTTPKQQQGSPNKHKQRSKFVHGNYNRYYGYRNPSESEDHRLSCLKQEWFEGKTVLDIGCNVGHITLAVARDFRPKKVVGIDIDPSLIAAARKNIRYYISSSKNDISKYPVSSSLNYGPIEAPQVVGREQTSFPKNVLFMQGNYVLECDELLPLQKEEYDTILALSVTKWVHFNNGDEGLKRFFKRIYRQLRPGGKLLLEPQPWSSYKKKNKLTEEIFKNYKNIKLRPAQFTDYLLSRDVGFSTCEVVDVPYNSSKGFRRPIQLFTKSDTVQNSPNHEEEACIEDPTPYLNKSSGAEKTSADMELPGSSFSDEEPIPETFSAHAGRGDQEGPTQADSCSKGGV